MRLTNNPFQALIAPLSCRPGDALPNPAYTARGLSGAAAKAQARFPIVENPWGLSPAQCAVMAAMVERFTLQAAADALWIDRRTAETHMARARSAMGATNSMHAVLMWDRYWREQKEGA